jgi:hypothetical protein
VAIPVRDWNDNSVPDVHPERADDSTSQVLRACALSLHSSIPSPKRFRQCEFSPLASCYVRRAAVWLCAICFVLKALQLGAAGEVEMTWGHTVRVAESGAWSRLAKLTNDTWLLVHTVFPRGQPSHVRILQSTNLCRDWTPMAELREPGRKFDNGNLLVLPSGAVLLAGRSLIEGQSYRLPVFRSTNGGGEWTLLSPIDANEGAAGTLAGHGLWEPQLSLLGDGRLTAVYSSEKHAGFSQIVAQKVSPDQGRTWGDEIRAVEQPGGGKLRPGMPVLTRMANRRFLLVYEVVGLGKGEVHLKTSPDGVNWPAGLGTRIPAHEAGPFALATEGGRIFVTSCANVISFSDDFGKSWRQSDLPPFPLGFKYSWPALYSIRPGEIAATVTSGGIRLRFGGIGSNAE